MLGDGCWCPKLRNSIENAALCDLRFEALTPAMHHRSREGVIQRNRPQKKSVCRESFLVYAPFKLALIPEKNLGSRI